MRFTWARKHYPYSRVVYRRAEGLAILTPHALGAAGHTELSNRASHNSWKRRIAQWALIGRADGSTIRAYNIHLSPHDDAASRRAEAVRLTAVVAEHGELDDVVIGGDFNDDRDASVIYALPGIEHLTPPPTNPADRPTKLLDHVLLPVAATDVSVTVPSGDASWAAISDHLPVTVRFTLATRFLKLGAHVRIPRRSATISGSGRYFFLASAGVLRTPLARASSR